MFFLWFFKNSADSASIFRSEIFGFSNLISSSFDFSITSKSAAEWLVEIVSRNLDLHKNPSSPVLDIFILVWAGHAAKPPALYA
jgi:hypothetical protein